MSVLVKEMLLKSLKRKRKQKLLVFVESEKNALNNRIKRKLLKCAKRLFTRLKESKSKNYVAIIKQLTLQWQMRL